MSINIPYTLTISYLPTVYAATPKCTSSLMAGTTYRAGFTDNVAPWGLKHQCSYIIKIWVKN